MELDKINDPNESLPPFDCMFRTNSEESESNTSQEDTKPNLVEQKLFQEDTKPDLVELFRKQIRSKITNILSKEKTAPSLVITKPPLYKRGPGKRCIVPDCKSYSLANPHTFFVPVPVAKSIRKRWYEAVGLDIRKLETTTKYCCGKHFKIDDFRLVKTKFGRKVNLRDDVLPHLHVPQRKEKESFVNEGTSEKAAFQNIESGWGFFED